MNNEGNALRIALWACFCCMCLIASTGLVVGSIALAEVNEIRHTTTTGTPTTTTTSTIGPALNVARATEAPQVQKVASNQKLSSSLRANLLRNALKNSKLHVEEKRDVKQDEPAKPAFGAKKQNNPVVRKHVKQVVQAKERATKLAAVADKQTKSVERNASARGVARRENVKEKLIRKQQLNKQRLLAKQTGKRPLKARIGQ